MQGFTGKGIFGAFADVGMNRIWAHQRRGPIVPNMRTLVAASCCAVLDMVQDDKTDLNTFGVHRTIHQMQHRQRADVFHLGTSPRRDDTGLGFCDGWGMDGSTLPRDAQSEAAQIFLF
jgi:hypothetical protein